MIPAWGGDGWIYDHYMVSFYLLLLFVTRFFWPLGIFLFYKGKRSDPAALESHIFSLIVIMTVAGFACTVSLHAESSKCLISSSSNWDHRET